MTDSSRNPLDKWGGAITRDGDGNLLIQGEKIAVSVDWWITASAISGAVASILGLLLAFVSGLDKIKQNLGLSNSKTQTVFVEIRERTCPQLIRETVNSNQINRTIQNLPCEERVTKLNTPLAESN